MPCPLETKEAFWESVPTVDNKAGKTYGPGAVTLRAVGGMRE